MMKKILNSKSLQALTLLTGLLVGGPTLLAQDGPPGSGRFDPAQMRERRMEQIRSSFEITDDSEWKVIAARIDKVMELRRASRALSAQRGPGGPGGFGGPGARPPRPERGAPPADAETGQGGPEEFRGPPDRGGRDNGRRPELGPEAEALQKAVQAKAPGSEIKARLEELKTARLKNRAELEKAEEDLKQLLTAQQEAKAVLLGLL